MNAWLNAGGVSSLPNELACYLRRLIMESLYVLVEFWHEGEFPPRAVSAIGWLCADDNGMCIFRSREAAEHAAREH